MKPLMEILEEERMLMLKLYTINHNLIRYPSSEASNVLMARKRIVEGKLNGVRGEIREYIEELFADGNSYE